MQQKFPRFEIGDDELGPETNRMAQVCECGRSIAWVADPDEDVSLGWTIPLELAFTDVETKLRRYDKAPHLSVDEFAAASTGMAFCICCPDCEKETVLPVARDGGIVFDQFKLIEDPGPVPTRILPYLEEPRSDWIGGAA